MKLEIAEDAERDLEEGRDFYERQQPGLGAYFATNLAGDIDALRLFAGIHPRVLGYHRVFSKRFPFGIYYRLVGESVRVLAVLDQRRDPAWVRRRLSGG